MSVIVPPPTLVRTAVHVAGASVNVLVVPVGVAVIDVDDPAGLLIPVTCVTDDPFRESRSVPVVIEFVVVTTSVADEKNARAVFVVVVVVPVVDSPIVVELKTVVICTSPSVSRLIDSTPESSRSSRRTVWACLRVTPTAGHLPVSSASAIRIVP